MVKHLASTLILVLVAVGSTRPHAAETRVLGYGSRIGMEVTVTSSSGLGTSNAIIVGRITEANAAKYCREYALTPTKQCAVDYMAQTRLRSYIRADCSTGRFSTFYGGVFQFVGRHRATDEDIGNEPEYDILDITAGEPLDGSSASGYSYDLQQFSALCPGRVRRNR